MKKTLNNISKSYCSIEVSKLLKDLGFDVFCDASWTEYLKTTEYNVKGYKFEINGVLKGRNSTHAESNSKYYEVFAAPTTDIALEWIRYNYGYFVSIYPSIYNVKKYNYDTMKIEEEEGFIVTGLQHPEIENPKEIPDFNTIEDAYNHAFIHILKVLIPNDLIKP